MTAKPEPPPTTPARVRRLGWALLLVGGPLLLLIVLFALPLLGNLVGLMTLPKLAECTQQAGTFTHCWLWGEDVAEIVNGYAIGIFLAGLINPMLFLKLLATYLHPLLVLAWAVGSLWLTVRWLKGRKALKSQE
ncbi:hypothetical protein [Roseomonas sp. 18066]|uniref:hypothetical protein n=1 Tax=Roseomonas sp. 18066 TaxID=2681412 RepID=UPI001357F936|nr:hypothetical protein [Roseomonas sp. 18066]